MKIALSSQVEAGQRALQAALTDGTVPDGDVPAVHALLKTLAWMKGNEPILRAAIEIKSDRNLKAALEAFPDAEILTGADA